MPTVFEYHLTVSDDAIDGQGHVNNLEYVRWMQQAAVAHSNAQGWPAERYRNLGAGWVVRSHKIEYLQAAFAGDQIVVYTWVADMRKVRSLRRYKMVRVGDGVTVATAETDWAFFGYENRLPKKIPPELIQSFTLLPADQDP
jgi:acyl-CoA thioester hydrolase